MAAHLLILIDSATAQVVDAMIASQGTGSMSAVKTGHTWAQLYQDNIGNFDQSSARILELLLHETVPAWSFAVPFLVRRLQLEYGQLISTGLMLPPTSEAIQMGIRLVLKHLEKIV